MTKSSALTTYCEQEGPAVPYSWQQERMLSRTSNVFQTPLIVGPPMSTTLDNPRLPHIANEGRWNLMLRYFSHGRYAGRTATDYILFDAIAPYNLMKKNGTRAWVLEAVRGSDSAEHLKLGPGSIICMQDRSRQEMLVSEAPAAFIGLSAIKWREPAYHIAAAIIHVYSRDTWMPIDEHSCLVAIPTPLIGASYRLGVRAGPTLGQHPIGNDQALPPQRYWEQVRVIRPPRKEDLVGEGTDNVVRAVEEWVSKQTRV
jgi:hypothetical protein